MERTVPAGGENIDGKCIKCSRPHVIRIRYSGARLCEEHFKEFVEKRFKHQVRSQTDIRRGDLILVALSGGKDSLITLMLFKKLRDQGFPIELEAVLVDEGIEGYRPPLIERSRVYCSKAGIPLHIVRFSERVGAGLDDIVRMGDRAPCAYCGVFRRFCLNTTAKRTGARYLATGHNLDDLAQTALMNFCTGEVERMNRIGPHSHIIDGLVPRIFPLKEIPEKESLLYAIISGLDAEGAECPYSVTAHRREYLDLLAGLEEGHPGTRHSIVKSMDAVRKLLRAETGEGATGPIKMARCRTCSEPMSGEGANAMCKRCELMTELGLDPRTGIGP